MNKFHKGSYRASRPHGFMKLLGLSIRMLSCPADIYRLIDHKLGYVEVPGRTLTDVMKVLSFACDHLKYGVTFIYDGHFVKVNEMDNLVRKEKERSERLQALMGTGQ